MTEPTVSLCGSCHAIAPSSAWLEHEPGDAVGFHSPPVRLPRVASCPACGQTAAVEQPGTDRYTGSWPAMIRKRLDLRAGAA